ncbi:MAG: hypothetical protein K2Q21_10750 [Chitinophagaceae bacterium]|nr:hypothetical protein [Chitinophagaceae bacterium]
MKNTLLVLFGCLLFACSLKKKQDDLSNHLKISMTDYLNNDSLVKNKFRYTVKSIIYFEDPKYYICEFQVRVTNEKEIQAQRKIDTTGTMKVKIDKNFKVISRYY